MEINKLNKRQSIEQDSKLNIKYFQFEKLINEMQKKDISNEIILSINHDIEQINSIVDLEKELGNQLKKTQSKILKLIEKELKLVTKNHYRNMWLALGMTAFGIPLGVVFGSIIGNMAFIGVGIPIGFGIGIVVGTKMDKKAFEEGRQLDLEIKY